MRKTILIAMLVAISMCIFIIEAQIPLPVPFPGVKPGLSNIIILITIILLGKREASLVLFLRIILSSAITGHGLIYSLFGGIFAFFTMCIFIKPLKNYVWVISVLGALAHNTGQILCASLILGKAVISYFPVLVISAIITGAFTGISAQAVILKSSYINKLFFELRKENK